MKRKIGWAAAAVLLAAACLWLAVASPAEPKPTSAQLVVTDALQREVAIPVPTERIVSLTNADTETLLALGVKPLAVVDNRNLPDTLSSRLTEVPRVGLATAPNVEQMAALRPDLVIGTTMGFQTSLAPTLEQLGIPAVFMSVSSYQEILDRITLLGKVTGRTGQAAALTDDITRRVEALRTHYAALPRRKVLILWGTPASFQLASSQTFIGDLVAQLPVDNVTDRWLANVPAGNKPGFVTLDMEEISRTDADEILIVTHGLSRNMSQQFLEELQAKPAWKQVKAVREGHVHELPGELFASNPNVRVADALAYLAEVLYD